MGSGFWGKNYFEKVLVKRFNEAKAMMGEAGNHSIQCVRAIRKSLSFSYLKELLRTSLALTLFTQLP